VLLLIYAAYFALRSAIDEPARRRRLAAVYNLFAAVTMPFLLFVAPRVAESTLHPNCAFIQGSKCAGIALQLGGAKIGLLGDNRLELLGLEQHGELAVARVQVTGPGAADLGTFEPTLELASGKPADRPSFAGQRFTLALEQADLATGTALLNMEAPGTGLLSNQRTLWTFLASIAGFTGLFFWLYRLRAGMLTMEEQLALRRAAMSNFLLDPGIAIYAALSVRWLSGWGSSRFCGGSTARRASCADGSTSARAPRRLRHAPRWRPVTASRTRASQRLTSSE